MGETDAVKYTAIGAIVIIVLAGLAFGKWYLRFQAQRNEKHQAIRNLPIDPNGRAGAQSTLFWLEKNEELYARQMKMLEMLLVPMLERNKGLLEEILRTVRKG